MYRSWAWLRECWALPDADATTQRLLLNRQLCTFFRLAVAYLPANILAAVSMFWVFWPGPGAVASVLWLCAFLAAHLGRDIHAFTRLRRSHKDMLSLSRRDMQVACVWCLFTATAWGIGLVVFSRYIHSPGLLFLIPGLTLGVVSAGVLSAISAPLIALIWLGVLTIASVFIVLGLTLDHQVSLLVLLMLYSILLAASMMSMSRLFVARAKAELLAESERQVVSLLLGDFEENASDWLWESDARGILTRASQRLALALAMDEEQIRDRELWALFSEEPLLSVASDRFIGVPALKQSLANASAFSDVVVEASVNGMSRSWSISAKPLHGADGACIGWRGVGSEVTDARAREWDSATREQHLFHQATHDSLTELPNRRAFFQQLARIEAASDEGSEYYAVALVDLDNFKAVNDALGHSIGDIVLRHVAERLQQCLLPGDFLARLGGDEFAVLTTGLPLSKCEDALDARIQHFLEQLRIPEEILHYQLDVRGSVGAAVAMKGGMAPDELMRRADIALYAAKGAGRDTSQIYQPVMGDSSKKRLSIVSDLSRALEHDELRLHYQGVIDIYSGKVVSCEALLRWQHPQHGLLRPDDFITIAEESGLIVPIGLWVLDRACRTASEWPDDIVIAVNVSAVQLNSRAIATLIKSYIRAAGLPPERVELEITESSLARDDGVACEVLKQLRSAGVHLSIDDFGTGYSSMSQLRDLPFDKIKIDRSFVASLGNTLSDASQSIVASLMHLSRLMNLTVVAEGVENAEQLDALRKLGCRYVQGFYFSEPVDADAMLGIIRSRNGLAV